MTDLTYVELFAGAGGMSLGLEAAGWTAVAHAEIEPHARAVLRKHWPDTPLEGDVSQMDGTKYRGVTLLTGGSPCQDLSIAGKRAGMTEGSGTRSSLFFEQVRIWQQTHAPYILWENVCGALSSNNGRDFAAVLSALVGAAVPVPSDGWESAGVAAGPTGVAAWRVLDAQYFGVPQRRRRVFVLGARPGGVDPAEVLLDGDGLCGDPAAGGEAGEGTAPDAGRGAQGGGAIPILEATARQGKSTEGSAGIGKPGDPMFTLTTKQHGVLADSAVAVNISNGVASVDGTGRETPIVVGVDKQSAHPFADVAPTLKTDAAHQMGPVVAIRTANTNANGHGIAENITHTLDGANGQAVTVMRQREGKPGGGKGPLLSEGKSLTLGTTNDQVVFPAARMVAFGEYVEDGTASAIKARNHKDATELVYTTGRPRRLMPVECERLMGWEDGWTALGIDEQGREYALKDTPRYKLCGNGCAAPVIQWIAWKLQMAIDSAATGV